MKVIRVKRWFILTGLFFISFLENGLARSFAVILDDLTTDLETSTAYLGAIFGLVFGASYFLAFVTIPLLHRFSVRQLTMFGGLISTLGLILSSFANSAPRFSAALSLFGLGYVVFISPSNSCPAQYFPDRFGLATGILLSGGSTGVMLLPFVFELIVNHYGWRGAVLLLGGINANMMVSGALLEPVCSDVRSVSEEDVRVTRDDAAAFDNPALVTTSETCIHPIENQTSGDSGSYVCEADTCSPADVNVQCKNAKMLENTTLHTEIESRMHCIYGQPNPKSAPERCEKKTAQNSDNEELTEFKRHFVLPAMVNTELEANVCMDVTGGEYSDGHSHENELNTCPVEGKENMENEEKAEVDFKSTGVPSRSVNEITGDPIPEQTIVHSSLTNVEHSQPLLRVFPSLVHYFELNLFKDRPLLVVVCIQAFLYGLSYSGWLIFVIPNAIAKGLPPDQAVQVSIAGGISNFFGRLGGGMFSSANYVKVEVWYYVVNLITAAAFFINFIADSFWFLIVLSAVYGIMIGAKAPAQFLLVMNATGKEQYSAGVSMLFFFVGLSFPVSGALFGAIYDGTRSYNIAFCIVGLLDIVVAHITITPKLRSRFCLSDPDVQ